MRVLVACEFSGTVRDAFTRLGHDAVSCDLLPSVTGGQHYQGDVKDILWETWDMIIAFPPCTHLAASGARWFAQKRADGRQQEGIDFFMLFTDLSCSKVAIENPISIMSTVYRKPDQIIQPWMFGHGETKATCLWLKGLPLLQPTNIVSGRVQRVHNLPPTKDRGMLRGITYKGIAEAMSEQWGRKEASW